MTDLLTTDSADSGEVVRLNPAIVDTDVLDLGEQTRNMAPYIHGLRPIRRPESTGEHPVYRPETIANVDELPTEPIPPTVYGPTRPDDYRARHRRPRPVWAWRALLVGAGSLGTVVLELASLAALAVLR
jgi:hypothetical protein